MVSPPESPDLKDCSSSEDVFQTPTGHSAPQSEDEHDLLLNVDAGGIACGRRAVDLERNS